MTDLIRRVLDLKSEGKTYREVSEEVGISITRAKQIIYRARKAGEYDPPPPKPEQKKKIGRPMGTQTVPKVDALISMRGDKHQVKVYGNEKVLQTIGDPKVTAFVQYHIDMAKMRVGADPNDVEGLYTKFGNYLTYCAEHAIVPSSAACYYAIGLSRERMFRWKSGSSGTPEQRQFAQDVHAFLASVHEQGAVDGIVNPIYSMWLQKAYDGMVEAEKANLPPETHEEDKATAEEIQAKYAGIELPD